MKGKTPLQEYQAAVRAARTLSDLVEARHRLAEATGQPAKLRGDAPAPEPVDDAQPLREAFETYGLAPDAAASAAAGRYGEVTAPTAPAPREPDAIDEMAQSLGYTPGSPGAVAFRKGRYQ